MVVTHDGSRLFAYAASRKAIEDARSKLQAALAADGVETTLVPRPPGPTSTTTWIDPDAPPPPRPAAARAVGTRTYVVTLGRWVREEFEQSIGSWADQLGVSYEIVEHPPSAQQPGRVQGHRARGQARRVRGGDERRGAGDDPHRDVVMASPL